tara:strand:+ start:152 stop:469 length:318 start_codon:yes stop_codon:yes gene_type:complete
LVLKVIIKVDLHHIIKNFDLLSLKKIRIVLMQTTIRLKNIKRLDNYLANRASILKGIYLLNENILRKKLINGERMILGVKVDNSFRIIEDTLNPFRFAYEFIGIS